MNNGQWSMKNSQWKTGFKCAVILTLVGMSLSGRGATISSTHFVLEYDSVDVSLAEPILDHSERAFVQVSGQLEYTPLKKTRIVLCSSEKTFLELSGGKFPEWGAAFAIPSQDLIILKSPRLVRRYVNFYEVVTHEVTHIILHDYLREKRIPRWLNEGFAMYQSREWKVGNSMIVGWAALSNSLYDLGELEGEFPESDRGADLAYSESFLAVAYIIQVFDKQGLMELLKNLRSGDELDQAMRKATGSGYERFKRNWMGYTNSRFSIASVILSPTVIWSLTFVLLIIVFVTRYRRNKKRLATMKRDDSLHDENFMQWDTDYDDD